MEAAYTVGPSLFGCSPPGLAPHCHIDCISTVFFSSCLTFVIQIQAALRQKELEKSAQWAQENDKTLRDMQEALASTDRHLTSYLADQIDAQQIPQEAQVETHLL